MSSSQETWFELIFCRHILIFSAIAGIVLKAQLFYRLPTEKFRYFVRQ